jgi:plastocyanin
MMRWLTISAVVVGALALVTCKAKDITSPLPGTVLAAARDSFFTPDTLYVTVGKRVRWTNEGRVYHTVQSDSSLWGSNPLAPTWWFEVRFDSAGTFPYHCSIHAGMVGTVIATP